MPLAITHAITHTVSNTVSKSTWSLKPVPMSVTKLWLHEFLGCLMGKTGKPGIRLLL